MASLYQDLQLQLVAGVPVLTVFPSLAGTCSGTPFTVTGYGSCVNPAVNVNQGWQLSYGTS